MNKLMTKDAMIRKMVKEMIELADSWQDADSIIKDFLGIKSENIFDRLTEKIDYVQTSFPVAIEHRFSGGVSKEHELKDDYIALLATIIDRKWR
jgi:hypothetical protein